MINEYKIYNEVCMAGYLNASMGAEVEVKLGGVCDANVHSGPCWDVATLADLVEHHQNVLLYIHSRINDV